MLVILIIGALIGFFLLGYRLIFDEPTPKPSNTRTQEPVMSKEELEAEFYFRKAKLLYEQKDFDGAINSAEKACELNPKSNQSKFLLLTLQKFKAEMLYRAALQCYNNGHFSECYNYCSASLKLDINNDNCLILLSKVSEYR